MEQTAQRRAAVVGLAVAATVSVVSVTFTQLHAQDTAADDSSAVRPLSLADSVSGDADLLKQGINQLKSKQYEDAKATLAQVNVANLSSSDQKKLADAQTSTDMALEGRKAAREQFEQGEAALNAGKLAEAKTAYKAAADNKYADDATKQKAKEQISLASAMQDQKAAELSNEYKQAKKDFDAGNYADAKAKFEQLNAAGYKAPMFQTSPTDFLKKIDAKTAAAPVAAEAAKPAEQAQTQTPAQPQADAQAAQKTADEEAKAAKKAEEAKAAEAKAQADAEAKAAKQAAEQQQKAQQQKARDAYAQGLSALKANDFATARESFKAADEAGFKPGLFQDSAAKMLAEVDKTEAQAKAEADKQAAKQKELDAKAQADADAIAAKQKEAEAKAQAESDKKAAEAKAKADKEAAEAQAKADKQAAEAKVKADKEAAEAQAKADKQAATTRQVAAREQYKQGLASLKAGNYDAARQSFKAADEEGFKPGLFEATASHMLAEVDRKEADAKAQADKLAAKEAEKAAKAQAEAQAKAEKQTAEAKPEVKAEGTTPAIEAKPEAKAEGTTPAIETKPETKAEGTTPAVETKPEAKAEGTTPAIETKPEATAPAAEAKPEAKVEAAPAAPTAAPVAATPKAQADLEATAKLEQIRAQARAYESQQLVDQARQAQKEGRVAAALELYTKAADVDPANQAAVDGKNQMLALQGRAPAAGSLLQQQQVMNQARRENITYSFNDAIDRARAAIAANNFRDAQVQVNNAGIARDQDPNLFTAQELKAFDTTLAQTRQELAAAQQNFQAAEQKRIAEANAAANEKRLAEERRQRQDTIAALIKETRQYVSQNKYKEALATTDQILQLDPVNDYARAVRPLLEDRALLQEQREYRSRYDVEMRKTLNKAEENLIPYDDIYRYPANWPDISESRDRIVEQERGLKEADRQVQVALDRRLPEIRFDGAPFEDVIENLRDITGTNIFVNWKALDAVPIEHKAPVSVRLRDVKFSKVLQTVLDSVSTDPANKLTYTVDEGVITISTTADVSSRVVTRVYDVTDLIIEIPSIGRGTSNFGTGTGGSNNSGTTGGSRTSGGGGSSTGSRSTGSSRSSGTSGGTRSSNSGSSSSSSSSGGNGNFDRQAAVEDISYLIQDTVATDSWMDYGGKGSIRPSPLQQQLIITQTPEVHRQIQNLLDQLREVLAIQVTVETRFLTVSRNFMDDVGLDFDLTFNPNGSSHWSPIPVAQNSSTFTANPSTGVAGSIGTSTPASSLTTSGTYLDQFQVSYLLRATQASVNQSVVTAPRVTVYNGGEAEVIVTTDTSYVASLDPEVASGVVGYTPTINTATDGVDLWVRANVSADRKYVTLYLYPQLTRLLDLTSYTFQTSTTIPSGTGNNNIFAQGALQIQEPKTQTISVETLVAVPDGGTLLLGGQTISGEVEKEAGVPVLSKIPVLKRLFTNRSTAKDESVLLILVKPTIIIQKEQEQKQFPLLSSKISGS